MLNISKLKHFILIKKIKTPIKTKFSILLVVTDISLNTIKKRKEKKKRH